MGLTSFEGERPRKSEVSIAKNYLNETELQTLNRMVSAFFDLAELRAMNHQPMYMKDWVSELDLFAERYGKRILQDAGKASHKQAVEKAENEYEKYRQKTLDELSPVEMAYLESIKKRKKYWRKKIFTKANHKNSHSLLRSALLLMSHDEVFLASLTEKEWAISRKGDQEVITLYKDVKCNFGTAIGDRLAFQAKGGEKQAKTMPAIQK
jgi:vacuolar-type H+-ATPase subunit H